MWSWYICKLRPCKNKDTGVMNFRSVNVQRNCIIAIVVFVVINYQWPVCDSVLLFDQWPNVLVYMLTQQLCYSLSYVTHSVMLLTYSLIQIWIFFSSFWLSILYWYSLAYWFFAHSLFNSVPAGLLRQISKQVSLVLRPMFQVSLHVCLI